MEVILGLREWMDRWISMVDGRLDESMMNAPPSLAPPDPTGKTLSLFNSVWG